MAKDNVDPRPGLRSESGSTAMNGASEKEPDVAVSEQASDCTTADEPAQVASNESGALAPRGFDDAHDEVDRPSSAGAESGDRPASAPDLAIGPDTRRAISERPSAKVAEMPDASVAVRSAAFLVQRPEPYVSPGRSARTHWRLVTVVTLLGMLAGAAVGFLRTPTYTAEERLVVGKTAQLSNLASIPGLDAAGQSLASSYSRLVGTGSVLAGTAKRLRGPIDGTLSGSPIPQSPVVLVEASARSSARAVAIANAASAALVAAVNKLNEDQSSSANSLLNKYEDVDRDLLVAQGSLTTLKQQLAAATGTAAENIQKQVNLGQTQVDGLQVKLQALAGAFNGVFTPTALNSQVLQSVGAATATGNNRKSTFEIGLLIGFVGGGLIALGLSVWLDLLARKRA